jgi:hypothetical protein
LEKLLDLLPTFRGMGLEKHLNRQIWL